VSPALASRKPQFATLFAMSFQYYVKGEFSTLPFFRTRYRLASLPEKGRQNITLTTLHTEDDRRMTV
jgi:hypothetical protein